MVHAEIDADRECTADHRDHQRHGGGNDQRMMQIELPYAPRPTSYEDDIHVKRGLAMGLESQGWATTGVDYAE